MPHAGKSWPVRVTTIAALSALAVFAAHATSADDKAADKAEVKISSLATTGPKPAPITPPDPAQIDAAIARGVKFLLDDQRQDGCWGSAEKTKSYNIYAPAPGAHDAFRAGVTSLALMALIEAEPRLPENDRAAVDAAIDRGSKWLVENVGNLRRATLDAVYNVWGHAYAVQALVRLHGRAAGDADRQKQFKDLAAGQVDMLRRYAFPTGGWAYYDHLQKEYPGLRYDAAFSFCTATALIALHEAKAIGIEVPQKLIDKAIASLLRQQKPDFSYNYGEYTRLDPGYAIGDRPAGSLGRSQACNLALRLYGDQRVTDAVMETWLDRLYARNGWLSIARKKPIAHESFFSVSGYFYYYGHWYAALCIDQLPAEKRKHFQDHLAHILLPLQEKDGTWWDYPLYNYHQQYGTSMAIMSLVRCRADWSPPTY
jgi:hypothetical protein